jgi:hypothetical protein
MVWFFVGIYKNSKDNLSFTANVNAKYGNDFELKNAANC